MSPARRSGVAFLLALATAGCALPRLPGAPPRLADCPGPLLPTGELPPGDFVLRERVRITGGDVDVGFQLVAEKRGERLVLVALNAFGAKAFAVTQQGLRVESESYLGAALQVPPENVLRDLHAARFARRDAPLRVVVARPGCGYTATFVAVLPRAPSPGLNASPSR